MDPRFQLDGKASPADSVLIDPEAYDASEQQFAASLEGPPPKFIVQEEPGQVFSQPAASNVVQAPDAGTVTRPIIGKEKDTSDGATRVQRIEESTASPSDDLRFGERADVAEERARPAKPLGPLSAEWPDSWRNEVSARLDRYRARRRPREPRYPSLRLKFDAPEPAGSAPPASAALSPVPVAGRFVADEALPIAPPEPSLVPPAAPANAGETTARIIPFRRSASAPPRPLEELADPVSLAPRILEAPDVAPPQPALGGILMDPVAEGAAEKRPGLEVPLQPAEMSRRLLATAIDIVLVLTAVALFGYVFVRTAGLIPPPQQAAAMALLLAGVLWPAYQYALLVYVGATPGLKLAKLRLSRFDGSAVSRSLRRWRVLASAVSGISLGLGYAWCILDEDQLCWHDRITETYMAPGS